MSQCALGSGRGPSIAGRAVSVMGRACASKLFSSEMYILLTNFQYKKQYQSHITYFGAQLLTKEAVLEKVPNSVFNKQHFSQDHYDDDEDETAEAERIHDEQEEEENYLESSPLSSLEPGSEVRRRRMH